MLARYENQICPFDREILHADRFTFSVLMRIMEGPCRLTLTDGARAVICHSAHPYPVWVWLPDDATEDELELVWHTLKTEFGVTGYRFNLKYALADYLIRRASEEGYTLRIGMNMFTYECPATVPPHKETDGSMRVATEADRDIAAAFIKAFHREAGDMVTTLEQAYQKADDHIANRTLFLWCDGAGEPLAMCTYILSGEIASPGNVYTCPHARRRGYAAHLMYTVTNDLLKMGKTPVLYTNADYAASNACYTGIGYVLRGSLCTLQ